MSKLAVRHGFSNATDRDNYGTPVFGNPKASLHEKGETQARHKKLYIIVSA